MLLYVVHWVLLLVHIRIMRSFCPWIAHPTIVVRRAHFFECQKIRVSKRVLVVFKTKIVLELCPAGFHATTAKQSRPTPENWKSWISEKIIVLPPVISSSYVREDMSIPGPWGYMGYFVRFLSVDLLSTRSNSQPGTSHSWDKL